jgi:hypothetical protein
MLRGVNQTLFNDKVSFNLEKKQLGIFPDFQRRAKFLRPECQSIKGRKALNNEKTHITKRCTRSPKKLASGGLFVPREGGQHV